MVAFRNITILSLDLRNHSILYILQFSVKMISDVLCIQKQQGLRTESKI